MATCGRAGCTNPVFVTPDGLAFLHCGRTCAVIARQQAPRCARQGCVNPKYSDASRQFDYCGKTCALLAIRSSAPLCARTGCSNRAYINMQDRNTKFSYCNPQCFWQDSNSVTATKLTPLAKDNRDYINVQKELHKTISTAKVHGIIRLTMPGTRTQAHLAYALQTTPSSTPGRAQPRRRMFHGTSVGCANALRLLSGGGPICSSGCGMCGITREGNRGSCSGHNGTMWFGPDANTSLGYCLRHGNRSGTILCMFVVDIVTTNRTGIVTVNADVATLPRYMILFEQHGGP